MKNNDEIPATDTTGIKLLIYRVKQGELDQGDALLIENPLNFPLTIVSLLQRKHSVLAATRGRRENHMRHAALPQGHVLSD